VSSHYTEAEDHGVQRLAVHKTETASPASY
jgi:hypothetical protein